MTGKLKEDKNGALHDERGYFVGTGNPGGIYKRRAETERKASEALSSEMTEEDWRELWRKEKEKAKNGDQRSIDRLLTYGQPRASEHLAISGDDDGPIVLRLPKMSEPSANGNGVVKEEDAENS